MDVIISIPHSSTNVPEKYIKTFSVSNIFLEKNIDYAVDKICNFPDILTIKAIVSRFVIDLNRKRDDVDSDQGVIIHKDWHGNPVLNSELDPVDIEERLKIYYDPYYENLNHLLNSVKSPFLIDCHSMDSKNQSDGKRRPDICLANRNKKSCSDEITSIFRKEFESAGYHVEENIPYAGLKANIITFTNEKNIPAIELEFNKSIYMDEKTLEVDSDSIKTLNSIMQNIIQKIRSFESKSL